MATFISNNTKDTEALGRDWGQTARPGMVIGLDGDLGAGKTVLVRGLATGLGIVQRVHSPTFALLNEYSGGRHPLAHIDLYRLETREQILGAGLAEYFWDWPGVVVVEWSQRWSLLAQDFGRHFRQVSIAVTGENSRLISYEDIGF